MRILLGISILVLVAILWTTLSIVRHICVTRRRNRFLREQENLEVLPTLLPQPLAKNIAPLPARFAAPILPTESPESIQKTTTAVVKTTIAPSLSPESTAISAIPSPRNPANPSANLIVARRLSRDIPQSLSRIPVHPQAETATEEQPLRILECVSPPSNTEIYQASTAFPSHSAVKSEGNLRQLRPAPRTDDEPSTKDTSQLRRPVRSVHSKPVANGNQPSPRPDWTYFNKDMGDLSDPLPGRIRDHVRLRSR